MWDRNQRRAYRNARRGYRYSYYRRTPFFGVLIFILIVVFISHFWYLLIPLAILGGFLFMWLRGSLFGSGNSGLFNNNNYQQPNPPNQYYQPSQQPYQPDVSNQYYQPPTSQPNPPYQQYDQGYQTPPQNDYQPGAQPYQPQPAQEQYEEPQAQYPQEMPPMG
jgi:hypothetical protein